MDMAGIIRAKRRGKDMTQEELAEVLGVSTSAVSLWESGKTMPDIATVPAICAVLEVSADELFGIDREKRESEINDIVEEAYKFGASGYLEDALAVIDAGLKQYPDSWNLIEMAMHYHYQLTCSKNGIEHKAQAQKLGERIVEKCTDREIYTSAVMVLCYLYSDCKDDRAEELLQSMDSLHVSRDVLATNVKHGDKQLEAVQRLIENCLDMLAMKMDSQVRLDSGSFRFTPDETAIMRKKVISTYHTVFENGDFGFYHCRLYNAENRLADYFADQKDMQETIAHLESAACHAIGFVQYAEYGTNEYVHTSLALRGQKSGGFTTSSPENEAKALLNSISHPRYDFIRDTPEFEAIAAKLAPYAGDWEKRE